MTTILISGLNSEKLITQGYGAGVVPPPPAIISLGRRRIRIKPPVSRKVLSLFKDYLELKTRNA